MTEAPGPDLRLVLLAHGTDRLCANRVSSLYRVVPLYPQADAALVLIRRFDGVGSVWYALGDQSHNEAVLRTLMKKVVSGVGDGRSDGLQSGRKAEEEEEEQQPGRAR